MIEVFIVYGATAVFILKTKTARGNIVLTAVWHAAVAYEMLYENLD